VKQLVYAIYRMALFLTKRALGGAHEPPTKVFRRLTGSVNKTIVKSRVAAAANTYTSGFPDVKFGVPVLTIARKAIRFRHPDCNPDWAQKLISLSMSRHLSTRNISSKSMHAFLSNLANRQSNRQTFISIKRLVVLRWISRRTVRSFTFTFFYKQTRANAFTSFVGGNDHAWVSEIFSDMKHRAASLRQLSL